MRVEAAFVRRGAPKAKVLVSGVGPRRAASAATRAASAGGVGVAVAGFGGALAPWLEPGDVIVGSELRARDGRVVSSIPGAEAIAGMLRRKGLTAHAGPIVSIHGPAFGRGREALAQSGAILADMESRWLAPAAAGRPFVVVRVVLDSRRAQRREPLASEAGARRAGRALRTTAAALTEWAERVAPREVILAAPRASCA